MAKQLLDNVVDLERKATPPVRNFFTQQIPQAFENVLNFERKIQNDIMNIFNKEIPVLVPPLVPPPVAAAQGVNVVLNPIEINGFYLLTGNNYVTFYVTSNNSTRTTLSEDWIATGVTGLAGQLVVRTPFDPNLTMESRAVKISDTTSESYIWSFKIQSDTEQTVAPYQAVTGATLYPPGQIDYTSMKRQSIIDGRYDVVQHVTTYIFKAEPPVGFGVGWTVENLKGFAGPCRVVSYSDLTYKKWINYKIKNVREMFAILAPIDNSIPENTTTSVYTTGIVKEPGFLSTFVPAKFTNLETSMAVDSRNFRLKLMKV